ncbi:HIT domain-containing protein [Candidatus Microgenomates bacterium]|nr:HIT domain-containing protein [Candidatus Microgenomates bacterium]
MKDCIFCKIVEGVNPAKKVYEDDDVLVFENINPVAEIHLLVCPKKHIESFLKIDESFSLTPMVEATQKIISEKNIQEGYKLVFNGGKYQTVPHLHWHLLAGKLEDNEDVLNKT